MSSMVSSSGTQAGGNFGPENFVGGVVALDFLNTVEGWQATDPEDHLPSFEEWLAWTRSAGLPCAPGARAPRAVAARFMRQLRSFRAAWREVLKAELAGRAADDSFTQSLNHHWRRANHARELRTGGDGVSCDWKAAVPAWERAFHAVVLSAVELLTDRHRLTRVHECPGKGCGWFFYDGSKNGSRRWCSMKTCGNVNKVGRFHARQRRR